MAKNQSTSNKTDDFHGGNTPDVSDVPTNLMTENTQTQTRSAVQPLFSPEKIADIISFTYTSASQKSARLQLTQHADWDMLKDKSAKTMPETYAGINALLKVAEGMIWGLPTFLVVAPPEKYLAKHGSGTYAYVSHLHNPDTDVFSFEYDGKEHTVVVKPEHVPTAKGWYRLSLDAQELILLDNEPLRDLNYNGGFSYHYCQTLSAILEGANISVGLGPKTIPNGLKVMDLVVQADDPVAGVGTYRFSGREGKRAREEQQVQQVEANMKAEKGEYVGSDSPDLLVPLMNGGTYSLANWNWLKRVPIYNEDGLSFGGLKIAADDIPSRIAVAQTIRKNGYLVRLA